MFLGPNEDTGVCLCEFEPLHPVAGTVLALANGERPPGLA